MLKTIPGIATCAACAVLAVVGLRFWWQPASAPIATKWETPRNVLACEAAQTAVKAKLAPAGQARFPSCETVVGVTLEGSVYVVASSFEMEDGSGVFHVHTYRVLVLDEGHQFRTSDPVLR